MMHIKCVDGVCTCSCATKQPQPSLDVTSTSVVSPCCSVGAGQDSTCRCVCSCVHLVHGRIANTTHVNVFLKVCRVVFNRSTCSVARNFRMFFREHAATQPLAADICSLRLKICNNWMSGGHDVMKHKVASRQGRCPV